MCRLQGSSEVQISKLILLTRQPCVMLWGRHLLRDSVIPSDPNLQQLLAARAQQLSINCKHFSSLNAALYILSKGPWIPSHISVHVRQAALAAVGVGWSWVNQVPTAFPFSHFDASVSLATLNDIPSNETTQVDAVFAMYATLCGNLSQSTRAFLFTKYEYQCNACTRQLQVSIDLFVAAVSSSTTIDDVLHRMTPVWNMAEIKEKQDCPCLELERASGRCLKLGPVVLIRLKAEQGETLPRTEAGLFPLGHQFSFQTRTYEICCLVTTNRIDQDSQLLIVQAGQTGSVTTYDHNNGLRVLDSSRINSKLFIVGVLILPVKSPKAILTTKDLITVAGAVDTAGYTKKQLKVVKGILKPPKKNKERMSSQEAQIYSNKRKSHSNGKKAKSGKPKRSQSEGEPASFTAIDPEGLPMTILGETGPARVGIISMFDGVGSVYHVIKKKLGKPPAIYIAAEHDPVLRRLVSAELGMREDQHWGYNSEGVATIYVKDVWDLLHKESLILRQAKAMYPEIKWLLISGSPCQDLTYAGYLNGLLGLTGKRSMLFFVVYVVLCHTQKLFGFESVRYLAENAGSMQVVQGDGNPKTGHPLERSEHFQLFLHCLGLPSQIPTKQWVWDTGPFFGIRRQRVFLRSHLDTAVPPSGITPGNEVWGPLIYLTNETTILAPLLRTRDYTVGGALKLSWTGYQPSALLWDYTFFGGKRSFALLCQLTRDKKIPQLPWASIVPAHFLPVWRKFLAVLCAAKSTTSTKDDLIEQLAPIFHNPNVTLPMRILSVQEVRKLSGLEAILTVDRHGPALLTDKVVRDFCGNSFHPALIDAALGTDSQLQSWVSGSNDGQPCHTEAPPIHDVYAKYQDLLRSVLEQGAKRGVQLKSDQVDFEAKWRHYTIGDPPEAASPPTVNQPTVFSFLQSAKIADNHATSRVTSVPFCDASLSQALEQVHMVWLRKSSLTFENVALSSRLLRSAIGGGIGFRVTEQDVKRKYIDLLQEYTSSDKLTAIEQLFTILQVATLGPTHQFAFGFIIWAPKTMQPPLIYVGAQKPCLLFLLMAHETDQPFQFGTAAYDYLQDSDFLFNSTVPRFLADVVQLSHNVMTTYPVTIRIDEAKHFIHLSEFAAIRSPICAMCFLSTVGARPCFVHTPGTTDTFLHLLGGLEGTGGLSIVGVITRTAQTLTPNWVIVHVVDNEQVQPILNTGEASPCRVSMPFIWSPAWYAQQISVRQAPRQIGKRLLHATAVDEVGEYLIFPGTEEWSRVLISLGEAPPE